MKKIFIMGLILLLFGCVGHTQTERGSKAPDFSLESVDGGKVSLASLNGKPAVLNFFATWCPYCVEEIPALKSLADKYAGKVNIVSVDLRESKEKVARFAKSKGINYMILLDKDGSIGATYGVLGIPANFLIDSDGNFATGNVGIEEIEAKLKQIVK